MRLTMKTYTDCGQLPLPEVMESLPGFGKAADSRIDSQTLVAGGQFVSPSVIGLKPIKVGKTVGNIDANHEASPAVTAGHQKENGGERGIRTPRFPAKTLRIHAQTPDWTPEFKSWHVLIWPAWSLPGRNCPRHSRPQSSPLSVCQHLHRTAGHEQSKTVNVWV